MFGWERPPRAPLRRRHDGQPRGAVGRAAGFARQRRRSPRRRRTTRTRGICGVLGLAVRGDRVRPARPHGRSTRSSARLGARRRRHRRRDARHHGDRLGRSAAGDPRAAARGTASASTSTRRTAATSGSGRKPRAGDARAPSTASARPTRSSSIRTSTGCSPTAAAACCSATRRSAASTSTTRRTPTSARPSCTSARSASSARGPGAAAVALWATQRLLPLVARRRVRARRSSAGREAALALHRRLRPTALRAGASRPELDIVVWAARAPPASESAPRARARDLRRGRAARTCTSRSPSCRPTFFDLEAPASRATARRITCLRSVLMKPEHRAWVDRIAGLLESSADAAGGGGGA